MISFYPQNINLIYQILIEQTSMSQLKELVHQYQNANNGAVRTLVLYQTELNR
jgi:hypothetical protein